MTENLLVLTTFCHEGVCEACDTPTVNTLVINDPDMPSHPQLDAKNCGICEKEKHDSFKHPQTTAYCYGSCSSPKGDKHSSFIGKGYEEHVHNPLCSCPDKPERCEKCGGVCTIHHPDACACSRIPSLNVFWVSLVIRV